MFNEKTLLITGGTGSFGNAVLRRFLKSDLKEIRIFSRDEKCANIIIAQKSSIILGMSEIMKALRVL